MKFTSEDLMHFRNRTGHPLSECIRALNANASFEEAEQWLRTPWLHTPGPRLDALERRMAAMEAEATKLQEQSRLLAEQAKILSESVERITNILEKVVPDRSHDR